MDISLLNKLENTPGRLDKEALLATANEETQQILKYALDPFITFGVTQDEEEAIVTRVVSSYTIENPRIWVPKMLDTLYKLSVRSLTGNDAKDAIKQLLKCSPYLDTEDGRDPGHARWFARILNKDLRCGVQVSTIKKVFPDLIKPFEVQLAKPYEPDKHTLKGRWCLEPKLDGLRVIILDGKAFTRNGKELESIPHILTALEPYKDLVFDGECMGTQGFNESSGQIRKKKANSDLILHVFDCMTRDEWFSRVTDPLHRRKSLLSALKFPACVKVVNSIELPKDPTPEYLFSARDMLIAQGYEGAMIKNLDSPYQFKRTSDLLKLKDFHDADGIIIGMLEGKGDQKGALGALQVDFDGVVTNVGSGFSDEQRKLLWKDLSILGKTVEVQYQEKTPDFKLRFPVFIKFRPDKDRR